MEAARRRLLADGCVGLSTRKVAEQGQVPVSQLHYFGSRQRLILALFAEENSAAWTAAQHAALSRLRAAPSFCSMCVTGAGCVLGASGHDRHRVTDGGALQGNGAVVPGNGGAQFGDRLVGPYVQDLYPVVLEYTIVAVTCSF